MAQSILEQKEPIEGELVEKIRQSGSRDVLVHTTLQTNEQVIARVTDGIYRQPASSLRELISNAYDADATRVIIKTDAPRFEQITIEDDGTGMSPEVLAHLLYNIGGSAKRSHEGGQLGITSKKDVARSPGGRQLIGKIGIGLFSVSQLTHSFQIVTKTMGDDHRTVATVSLRQFSDSTASGPTDDGKFESGKVTIWRERATDKSRHGTTIALTKIRPQARDTLRSRDIWDTIEHNEKTAEEDEKQAIEPPRFHVGRVDSSGRLLKKSGKSYSVLPWTKADKPNEAFSKLVNSVWEQLDEANPNPKLERIFDYYLRMVWQLALAVPLPYVDGHLFDRPAGGWTKTFELSNKRRGSAEAVKAGAKIRIRDALKLTDPPKSIGEFTVFVDDLKLARPVRFNDLPVTDHALKHPLVFIGKCDEKFEALPAELSGGPLKFEAYLFWSPKIAPSEHQGALVRIHGASGTGYDSTFMRYQIAELTRLRQITCEILVSEGLESALNIDRESFNNAHPHAVFIARWLHSALRQLATVQKKEAAAVRSQNRDASKEEHTGAIERIVAEAWAKQTKDAASLPPSVQIVDEEKPAKKTSGSYVFKRSAVTVKKNPPRTPKEKARREILEEKLKAITQILVAFNALDRMTKSEQEELLLAISKILEEREE
jgi:hypothetical protein